MPRRSVLTAAERQSLLAWPDTEDQLIRHYTFSESDLAVIRQHRGAPNRLGFAVQLCYMRYPGVALAAGEIPFEPLLRLVAAQVQVLAEAWADYGQRDQTRREHQVELQSVFGFRPFGLWHYRAALHDLDDLASRTDKGLLLAAELVERLRSLSILLPALPVIERICAESITRGQRKIFRALTESLGEVHRQALDGLLELRPRSEAKGSESSKLTVLAWLRQPPAAPNAKHLLEHIERLEQLRSLNLPEGIERRVHQNRLLKIAREGAQMKSGDLAKLEPDRRYATLAAVTLETRATLTDEIIDLHDRILGALFNRARHNHEQEFQKSGKEINEKVRLYSLIGNALLEAKQSGSDPFAAIESLIPWEEFTQSVAEAKQLARSDDFDYLGQIVEGYGSIRRYAPAFLESLSMKAAPTAQSILDAVDVLQSLHAANARKEPPSAPTSFVKKRWKPLVFTDSGLDRRFYELCTLSELKNALRSGDIWVQGSRQFRDFQGYLLPADTFASLKRDNALPLAVLTDGDSYLSQRLQLLGEQLDVVNRMAAANELPDAVITEAGLKITPLTNSVPDAAATLIHRAYNLLPRVKITELLIEVEEWTGFTRHFTHIKTGLAARDRMLLLTTILADAINLGLTKMAEACPGTDVPPGTTSGMTYDKLSWLQSWHIREETYSAALAELVNAQLQHPLAGHWGQGRTSSSDGQRFKLGSHAQVVGNINPKYGSEPGVQFYTHISDQYSPFHTRVISVGVRDATYVLDGLLYHESDLRIEVHYTDTAGFTDHVFALMHLLGFRFAPRIRDLADKRLFVPGKHDTERTGQTRYPALATLLGGTINTQHIRSHWEEIRRLVTSIRQGTVTASLMLRKLGSYPRQNGLALALRELGRIERTLFTLDWLQDVELRRRVQAGLNKGEARNALARAIFFNRLGEVRDRSFETQRHRASGLNLVTAAIVLWNTVYLERAIQVIKDHGHVVDEELLQHLSPLAWEHINLTGDYLWQ